MLSCGYAPSNLTYLALIPPKQLLAPHTLRTTPAGTWATSKWLLPLGEGKITTYTNVPIVPGVEPFVFQYSKCPADQSQTGSGIWYGCLYNPPRTASEKTRLAKHPESWCDYSPSRWVKDKHLEWLLTLPKYRTVAAPDCHLNSIGTKSCLVHPQQLKWTKQMKLSYNSRTHMTYMGDIHEVLGSGE